MYYRFNNNYIQSKTAKIALSTFDGIDEMARENNLPIRLTPKILGYRAHRGVLSNAFGVSRLTNASGVEYPSMAYDFINVYSMDVDGKTQVIACSDYLAYVYREDENKWEMRTDANISGQDAVIFSSKGEPSLIVPKEFGGLYRYNGYGFFDMNLSYEPVAMCAHMNRLFLVDKSDEYRIRFSGFDDPSSFEVSLDAGGEIYMGTEDGEVLKMISYNGNLYIFREYAIYRLTAYADQREFVMRKMVTSTSRIKRGSIALTNNEMIYIAEDGVYSFDTYASKRIMSRIDDTAKGMRGNIVSTYFNGRYYVAYGDNGAKENNRLLEIDFKDGGVSIIEGINVSKFAIIRTDEGEKLAIVLAHTKTLAMLDDVTTFYGKSIKHIWSSGQVDFDISNREKTISNIIVRPLERYTLTVTVDKDKTYVFDIDGEHRNYQTHMRGYSYDFTITSDGVTDIHPPILEVKV